MLPRWQGLYFNAYQIERGLADPKQRPFLVEERLRGLSGFGGVRIEDMVVVTEEGIEQITTIPRDIDSVEAICRGEIVAEAFGAPPPPALAPAPTRL